MIHIESKFMHQGETFIVSSFNFIGINLDEIHRSKRSAMTREQVKFSLQMSTTQPPHG